MATDLLEATSQWVGLLQASATAMRARMAPRSADLVFTSPPYFDKERYGDDALQSYVQFPSYRDWLEGFLQPAITQSFRVLKKGGVLALNVSDTRRFPLAADTHAIMRAVLGNVTAYKMRMRRLPSYDHFDSAHRVEKILVSCKMASARRRATRS